MIWIENNYYKPRPRRRKPGSILGLVVVAVLLIGFAVASQPKRVQVNASKLGPVPQCNNERPIKATRIAEVPGIGHEYNVTCPDGTTTQTVQ